MKGHGFDAGVPHLRIDPVAETARIGTALRQLLSHDLRRRGLVVGLSGGIDSSVTAALAVQALGKERAFALLMPERDSSPDSRELGRLVAEHLSITCVEEDITPILEAVGFYRRYDAAVRTVVPGYGDGWKSKLVISGVPQGQGFTYFSLVTQSPTGEVGRVRLPASSYLEILAATSFKQRTRKMLEYYHADRLNYAVAGTPNRLEYDQGFFVKNGDGAADVKPIAHLYKSQVYQLAEYLELPEAVRTRPPTTDTYSMPQGQDEFYFSLPYRQMDICLFAKNNGVSVEETAAAAGLSVEQVLGVWRDIDAKRAGTRYLHLPPLLVEPIPEVPAGAKEAITNKDHRKP
jgi:NAD+ synthase